MLTAVMTELEAFDPRPMSRPELADALAAHDRLIARAEANRLAILATVDELGDRGADATTMGRSISRRSERRAKSDAKVAGVLVEMPRVAEKLAAGQITTEHATACADAAARLSPAEADELASMAAAMPADRFTKKSREWINKRESALAKEQRFRRQRRNRRAVTWSSKDGMLHLHAELDPLAGKAVVAALDERTDQLWRADGGRDGSPDDVRSHDQRRADALADIISAASPTTEGEPAPAGTPSTDASHPRFMVHLFYNVATGTLELIDGEPLPSHVLAEIGPHAEVVGEVFSADGHALWLGRSKRLADRAQWIALISRDRGCDDCGAPVSMTEAHHPVEWDAEYGPTDIDNLELKCHTCHATIHRRRRRPGQAA